MNGRGWDREDGGRGWRVLAVIAMQSTQSTHAVLAGQARLAGITLSGRRRLPGPLVVIGQAQLEVRGLAGGWALLALSELAGERGVERIRTVGGWLWRGSEDR